MSAPTSNAPFKPSGTPPKPSSGLEADIAILTQLLSGTGSSDSGEGEDVVELLRRLEAAEGLADGMEERLDGIMDSLDDLLSDLEARTGAGQEEGVVVETAAAVVVEEEELVAVVVPGRGEGEGEPSEK